MHHQWRRASLWGAMWQTRSSKMLMSHCPAVPFVVGRIMAPKDVHILILVPVSVLFHGNKKCAVVRKSGILRWRDYPPNATTKALIKGAIRAGVRQEVTMEAKGQSQRNLKMLCCWLWRCSKEPQAKECRWLLGAKKKKKKKKFKEMDFPVETPAGPWPCQNLHFSPVRPTQTSGSRAVR